MIIINSIKFKMTMKMKNVGIVQYQDFMVWYRMAFTQPIIQVKRYLLAGIACYHISWSMVNEGKVVAV